MDDKVRTQLHKAHFELTNAKHALASARLALEAAGGIPSDVLDDINTMSASAMQHARSIGKLLNAEFGRGGSRPQ